MKMGMIVVPGAGPNSVAGTAAFAQELEAKGFHNLWLANAAGHDAITTLAVVGTQTERIQLGSAVTPTYPRHPTAMVQQALTAADACGGNGRFVLGIGLSHKVMVEDMMGIPYATPAKHMREYLGVLMPGLRGETIDFSGDIYDVHGLKFDVPAAGDVPVLVAGLGPLMLKATGELADGTITWMVGPKTMETHIIPKLREAAAGRADPLVSGGYPVVLTNRPDEVRASMAKQLEIYGMLPSYRAMLDIEGVAGPEEIGIIGDENLLRSEITRLADLGVTHFNAAIATGDGDEFRRTLDFLADFT